MLQTPCPISSTSLTFPVLPISTTSPTRYTSRPHVHLVPLNFSLHHLLFHLPICIVFRRCNAILRHLCIHTTSTTSYKDTLCTLSANNQEAVHDQAVAYTCLLKHLMNIQLGLVGRLKTRRYPEQEWKEVVNGLQPGREEYEEVRRMQGGIEALLGDGESRVRTERLGSLREML